MREASKSLRRRWCEDATGVFPWRSIFRSRILDVGAGDDPLPFPGCIPFDKQDGDAEKLSTYFEPESFDVVHASQCLEHMSAPASALKDWLRLVKRGGHLIASVPDWVAYEGMTWPSRWNGDHRASWSMIYRGSIAPIHIHIPTFLAQFADCEVLLARFVDNNYDYKIGTAKDQTFDETEGVEAWNEFVLKKK